MDVIFEALEAQGRTQRWLARQLGIHWTHLTHYKNGSRKAPDAIVLRSAELLGLPPSVLVQRADMFPAGDDRSVA